MKTIDINAKEWFDNTSSGYGNLLKKYDPIAFEVGYQDWKR